MKLLFKQRFFSWFDSYDIYHEDGSTAFTVEGKLSWGHRLEIYGPDGTHLGRVQEEILTLLPRFVLYEGDVAALARSAEASLTPLAAWLRQRREGA